MNKSALYVGVTSNLYNRVSDHRNKRFENSYTAQYNCALLMYYKGFDSIEEAIKEEKRIKGGSRARKEKLINSMNPEWKDLWEEEVKNWW